MKVHYETPVPYGQDRLIPIWVATMAVRQRSRTLHFGTASELLDFFHLFKDGKRYRRITEGLQRLFAATILFGTNEQTSKHLVVDWARFHFFDRMHLWFHKPRDSSLSPATNENSVILSEVFYEEIDKHRIPVEREVVGALADAPGVLDLYLWLVWKTWHLNGSTVRIPLFAPGGLADQLGTREYCADRFFRRKLSLWLVKVRTFWPHCPARISEDSQALIIHSSKKTPAVVCKHSQPDAGFNRGI